ncbi:hypothetical protein BH24DEI2_BH24DEI2_25000 [soil metagenome]
MPHLFDSELLDRLEGLNERYALLTRQIETLQDEAAVYDQPPDPGKRATFEALQQKVKAEVVGLLEGVVREIKTNG